MSPTQPSGKPAAEQAMEPEGRPLRGRPRSEDSHEAILDAVLRLLDQEGYSALTIEGVARHAGVGKQTIYRWWKCKAELVLEAYANHAASKLPMPDKGSLRADLEWFFCGAFKRLTDISGPTMRGLMADAVYDPEFLEILREVLIAKRRAVLLQVLERGRARGELRPDADLDVMSDLLFGALWYRLLVQHAKLDSRFAKQLVGSVLDGFGVRA
ncbi:MAG TPA: TetR/AcrR family transcriptional regulator [Burkholderiales bacterium]|nr:TetR/AcrR family transcriptional regulator [Burkholderiales bacterium]